MKTMRPSFADRMLLAAGAASLLSTAAPALAQSASEGERIYKQKCTACHTIGKGKLVGPDLQGVTSRREVAWLRRQIKEPNRLIAEGDPIATKLVKEAGGAQMVPLGLTDAETESVIAFLGNPQPQQQATPGVPSQYWPTLLIGAVAAIGLTGLALRAGKKNVDGR